MATNLTQRGPNATAPARLPGIQTSRVEDPNTRQALDALREWVEVRLGSRGDFWERALTHREYKLDMDALKLLIDELQRQINALLADRGPGSGTGVTAAEFAAFRSYVLSELATLGKCCEPPVTGEVPLVIRQGVGYAAGRATARNQPPPLAPFDPGDWSPSGDPHWSNVIFLSYFEGADGLSASSSVDESSYGQTIGVTALEFESTGAIQGATSLKFDGTNSIQCLDYNVGPEGIIDTQDWTIELVVDPEAVQGSSAPVLITLSPRFGPSWQAGNVSLHLTHSAPYDLAVGFFVYNFNTTVPLLYGTTDLRGGGAAHIAVSRVGNNWYLGIKGFIEDTATWSGSVNSAALRRYVGGSINASGFSVEGPVDCVRETVGVGRYTGTYTPPWTGPTSGDPNSWTPGGDPHWANVIFLNRFNGTNGAAVSGGDESTYGQGFIGFSRYTTTSPIEGTAWVNCTTEYSNPSDQYASGAEGAIGTGDWTYEIILDADATQGGFALIMGGGNNTGYFFANGYGLILQNSAPPNNLGLWIYNYSAVGPLLKSTTDLRGAGPTAVAVSKIGSTWRLFINGVVEDTQTWAGSIDGGINRTRYLRGHGNGGVIDRYLGKYDAVRETVGVGRYASNYTPLWVFGSSSPPLDVLLNLQFDGVNGATTTTDASFNAYTISLLGGATLSTAQFQSGTASLFCNGTGGRALVAGTSPATIPAFPGGDIVLYVRPSTVADCVLAIQGDAAGYTWRLSVVSGKIVLTDNAMPSYTPVTITASSAPSLSVGTWTKITIRRSGNPADLTAGLINLLIDDVFAAYGNWNSISYGISTAGLTIGANYDGTSAFHGYIDAVTAETF